MDRIVNTDVVSRVPGPQRLRRQTEVYFPKLDVSNSLIRWPGVLIKSVYRFSFVLLILVSLGFASITPLDVIVQTSGASSWGIKIFVVIIVCVVFVILLLVIYFLRIYKARAALRDITASAAYMPFEGDFPSDVFKAIDSKLSKCVGEIKVKAGPLYNEKEIINHPGLSPPTYVQKRNEALFQDKNGSGRLLPPDACYEDVVKSLSDKLMIDQKFLNSVEFPPSFTIRELLMFLVKTFNVEAQGVDGDKLVELYEKFRFGPDLIREDELFDFIVRFDKLGQAVHADQTGFLDSNIQSNNGPGIGDDLGTESLRGMPFASGRRKSIYGLDWASVFDEYDAASALDPMPDLSREMTRSTFRSVWHNSYADMGEMARRRGIHRSGPDLENEEEDGLWKSGQRLVRQIPSFTNASFSSSLVRNRLSLSDAGTSSRRRISVENSTSEEDEVGEEDNNDNEDEDDDDEFGVYDFRRKSLPEDQARTSIAKFRSLIANHNRHLQLPYGENITRSSTAASTSTSGTSATSSSSSSSSQGLHVNFRTPSTQGR